MILKMCFVAYRRLGSDKIEQGLTGILLGTLNHLSLNALAAQGRDMSQHLHQAVSHSKYSVGLNYQFLYDMDRLFFNEQNFIQLPKPKK